MSLFEEVKTFTNKIQGDVKIEIQECAWYINEDEEDVVYYNLDSNLEELYKGDGSSYSNDIQSMWSQEDCFFFNVYDGCGGTHTLVLPSKLEVDYEDLEEMFGGDGD